MITRSDILNKAVDDCMKELYSLVQPSVDWDDFIEQNKIYSKKYKVWERFNHLFNNRSILTEKELIEYSSYPVHNWENKSITECIGPRPYEFYYLPKDIMKDICDSYIEAYGIDNQQQLLNTIQILKDYCREPIIDKYIDDYTDEYDNYHPGYKSYDHPDNLEKEITKILTKYDDSMDSEQGEEIVNKFFKFLDMAGDFYNWNGELNSFNTSVYLGASPNTNKETVIENWKKYRGKDIEINEEQIKKEYYGEDELD